MEISSSGLCDGSWRVREMAVRDIMADIISELNKNSMTTDDIRKLNVVRTDNSTIIITVTTSDYPEVFFPSNRLDEFLWKTLVSNSGVMTIEWEAPLENIYKQLDDNIFIIDCIQTRSLLNGIPGVRHI